MKKLLEMAKTHPEEEQVPRGRKHRLHMGEERLVPT
jgi:hypothetical protein